MPQSRLIKPSHGSKGRLNLIQKEESVKDWLIKLIGRLGLALLKFSFNTQTKRRQRLRSSPQIPRTMEKEKAEETEKEKAEKAKQEAMEEQWRKNGCFKDSSGNWVFPDELMWRSLPRGEDR